jgi:hypothetical protein
MPNAKTHKLYSLAYLGTYSLFLNHLVDAPAKQMKHIHRALYHDYRTVQLVEELYGHDAALEVLLHIIVDHESIRPHKDRLIQLPPNKRMP